MIRPDTSRRRFPTTLRVRYADTDAMGAVRADVWLEYFEVARVEALRGLGVPVGGLERDGIFMPVVEARLTSHRPARLDDLLEITVLLDTYGPASFAFDYEVRRDGLLLASGWTRLAVCDRETGRSMPMPGWLKELFTRLPLVAGGDS